MRRLVVLCGLLLGCAGSVPEEGPRLEIGTGTFRYEPLVDGQELPMVRGAQGGWHVWISVRAERIASNRGSLAIELQPADESMPPQASTFGVQFDPPDAQGGRNYLGWAAILPDPSCAVGRMQHVRATLTLPSGRQLEAERYFVPTPGANPPPPCEQ